MLTLKSSTIFVADIVIHFGRYGLFVWPIWSVADMVQTREKNVEPSQVDPCLSGNMVPTLNNNIPGSGVPMIYKEIQERVD